MRVQLLGVAVVSASLATAATAVIESSAADGARAASSPAAQTLSVEQNVLTVQKKTQTIQQKTLRRLIAIDDRLSAANQHLVNLNDRVGNTNQALADVRATQQKIFNRLFVVRTWLNRGDSSNGYMGRLTTILFDICTTQNTQYQQFQYCTDNVSGPQPQP
jgi:TolA-binding protein